jgi:hypothetical protein
MALRLSIPETKLGSCGAGTARVHSGGLILTHSAIVQRPLRVESFDVNFEMLLDHPLIPIIMDIVNEIHHMNRPIRRSGSVHRSKPQNIFRSPSGRIRLKAYAINVCSTEPRIIARALDTFYLASAKAHSLLAHSVVVFSLLRLEGSI